MNRSDINELYFITHIGNVQSIMRSGIVSRNKAERDGINNHDISEGSVQDRRSGKKIPGTRNELHDYANLYFDAHNPMLSARRSRNNEICVLSVNNDILDLEGVIVTDKNAARECWFKPVDIGLPLLDAREVFAEYWTSDDLIKEYRLKGIKCAEVLVLDCVAPEYISDAYVANRIALKSFKQVSSLPVRIKNGLFF
ncbi:MAG: DUF4433 domain-containing protein [Candidatus Scalindua sp.]